jgi:Fe-S-cluster-containing hydrogenase component 2
MFGLSKNKNNTKEAKDMALVVKTNRCPQNHKCPSVRVCPVGALLQHGFDAPTVNMEKCIKCGKCTKSCPMRALVLE